MLRLPGQIPYLYVVESMDEVLSSMADIVDVVSAMKDIHLI